MPYDAVALQELAFWATCALAMFIILMLQEHWDNEDD